MLALIDEHSREYLAHVGVTTLFIKLGSSCENGYAEILNGKGLPTSSGELVVLEPEKWVGDKLPIAGFIDIDVSKGNWIVVLHRHDCSECQEAVPKYEQLAATLDDIKLAFVEVPPFGDRNSLDDPHWHHGHLKADVEWFVQTPVEIQVRDGVVKNASIQLPTLTEFGVR